MHREPERTTGFQKNSLKEGRQMIVLILLIVSRITRSMFVNLKTLIFQVNKVNLLHRLAQHASPTTTRLRKDAWIDENQNKSAHIDSCSHVNGEFVSSGFWWAFNEANQIMYFHSVILHYIYDKLRLSQVEKWQTSYVWFVTQFKQDQNIICLSSFTTGRGFPEIRSHGVRQKHHK